jgi:hypothetical protein
MAAVLRSILIPAATIVPVAALVLFFVGLVVLHRRKLREAALNWSGRRLLPDAEFLRACEVPEEPFPVQAALSARRAIASLATVPSETIYPEDSFFNDLRRLPFCDSLDWLGFVLEVEKQSGGEVRMMGSVAEGAVKAAGDFKSLRVKHIVRSVMTAALSRPSRGNGSAGG